MQKEIIAAIADCLNKQEVARQKWNGNIVKFPVVWPEGIDINEIAREIAASIAPLVDVVDVVDVDWKNAPEWAEWQTIDRNGQVTFWEKQPYAHLLSGYWVDDAGGNREYRQVDSWQYKSQQRPK